MKQQQADRLIKQLLYTYPLAIDFHRGEFIYKQCMAASDILTRKELIQLFKQHMGDYSA